MARMIPNKTASGRRPPPAGARSLSPEARQRMIDEAAYYRFVQRGYAPGHELEDWLAAEADFERQRRREQPSEPGAEQEIGMAGGRDRSPREDDALKRRLKAHPRRDIPRIESMEPEDAPLKE